MADLTANRIGLGKYKNTSHKLTVIRVQKNYFKAVCFCHDQLNDALIPFLQAPLWVVEHSALVEYPSIPN